MTRSRVLLTTTLNCHHLYGEHMSSRNIIGLTLGTVFLNGPCTRLKIFTQMGVETREGVVGPDTIGMFHGETRVYGPTSVSCRYCVRNRTVLVVPGERKVGGRASSVVRTGTVQNRRAVVRAVDATRVGGRFRVDSPWSVSYSSLSACARRDSTHRRRQPSRTR